MKVLVVSTADALAELARPDGVEVVYGDARGVAAALAGGGFDAAIVRVIDGDSLALLQDLDGDPSLGVVVALLDAADLALARRVQQLVGPLGCAVSVADVWILVSDRVERHQLERHVVQLRSQLHRRDQALAAERSAIASTAAQLRSTSSHLETATERLVEAEQLAAVGRVVTGIAHELSRQLALVGYAEALKRRVAADPELVELADVIVHAQKRLAAMVEEIRDFAGGAHRGIHLEPADLAAVVDEALAILTYDRDARQRTLARSWRARPLVALDHDRFAQVVINLVHNAVLATDPGDELAITIEARDGKAVVAIADRGVGMSPEVVARLGEPFFTTRGDQGSGLGVGICKRIVEEHGGSLAFTSQLGVGTTAEITLPLLGGGP